MSIEQEKMIVQSLSSLYPLQEFEEKAIDTVLNAIPHWIPVEQDLPEKEGKYLCTRTATWCVDGKATKVTDVAVLDYSDNIYDIWKDDGEIFQNGFAFGELWQGKLDNVQKVSAWMPMPEPYKSTVPPECEGDCGWCKPSVIEKCKVVTE